MKKLLILIFVLIQVVSSCSKSKDSEDPVLIRINNQTGDEINETFVNTGEGQYNFGTLKSGEKSPYKNFLSAYRYSYVRLTFKNKEYILQPIDYVGETKLEPGKHTYKFEMTLTNGQYILYSSYQKD